MKRPHVLSRSVFPQSPICRGSRNQCVLAPSELRIDHCDQVVNGIGEPDAAAHRAGARGVAATAEAR